MILTHKHLNYWDQEKLIIIMNSFYLSLLNVNPLLSVLLVSANFNEVLKTMCLEWLNLTPFPSPVMLLVLAFLSFFLPKKHSKSRIWLVATRSNSRLTFFIVNFKYQNLVSFSFTDWYTNIISQYQTTS